MKYNLNIVVNGDLSINLMVVLMGISGETLSAMPGPCNRQKNMI